MDLSRVSWRTSSYSGGGNQCVEIGAASTAVGIRDSKDRSSGTLAVTSERFVDFLIAIKDGKFDR